MRELLTKLRKNGIKVESDNEDLKIKFLDNQIDEDLLNEIKSNKSQLVDYLKSVNESRYTVIKKADERPTYPVSSSQKDLWILCQNQKSNIAYNIFSAFTIKGQISLEVLKKTIAVLVDRHESLRTVFIKHKENTVEQVVLSDLNVPDILEFTDFRNSKGEVDSFLLNKKKEPFSFETGPLFKLYLLQTGADEYILAYCMHHIISDAWSMQILFRELLTIYNSIENEQDIKLEPLEIQYKDFAVWQDNQIKSNSFKEHSEFWGNLLSGELPVLNIEGFKCRPKQKTYAGDVSKSVINKTTLKEFEDFCKDNNATLYMGIVAVTSILLHKYSGQSEFIFSSPVTGRNHVSLTNQIGYFTNPLPIKISIDPFLSGKEMISYCRNLVLDIFKYQDYPYAHIVKDIEIKRDSSRSSLFDIDLTFNNEDAAFKNDLTAFENLVNFKIEEYELKEDATILDILFYFARNNDELNLFIKYNTDIYDDVFISQLNKQFNSILKAIVNSPDTAIQELDYIETLDLSISEGEVYSYEHKESSLIGAFRQIAKKFPNEIALVDGATEYSYKDLDTVTDKLAVKLITEHNITKDDIVGVLLDRSDKYIITILAILKANGAFLPLDPSNPFDFNKQIFSSVNSKLLITNLEQIIDASEISKSVCAIDVTLQELEDVEEVGTKLDFSVDGLAYVIFTSGSTGKPKGVPIKHKSICNTIYSKIDFFELNPLDSGTAFSSISFDASVWDIFTIILSGGALHIIPNKVKRDINAFEKYLIDNKITFSTLTPSYLTELDSNSLVGLRNLVSAGEALTHKIVDKFKDLPINFYNAYGPTETSICSNIKLVEDSFEDLSGIPIGTALRNTNVFLVNEHEEIVPKGVIGEMCISGVGVAEGYIDNLALTNEQFVLNEKTNTRYYKTGDLAKMLPNGDVLFLGRNDNQLKIRGHRVELEFIENALNAHPNIDEAVVIVKKDSSGHFIVAFVKVSTKFDEMEVRNFLADSIPNYMLPKRILSLDKFPLTTNLKIDLKKLKEIEILEAVVEDFIPENELEKLILETWKEELAVNKISSDSDFFVLGGDSMLAIRLINNLNGKLGFEITVDSIYEHPNIGDFCKNISNYKKEDSIVEKIDGIKKEFDELYTNIVKEKWFVEKYAVNKIEDVYLLSDVQKGILYENQINPELGIYIDQFYYPVIFEDLSLELLNDVLLPLVKRHPMLRTSFDYDENGLPIQIVHKPVDILDNVFYTDLSNLEEAAIAIELKEYIKRDRKEGFDIASVGLWRIHCFKFDKERYGLIHTMHHSQGDGWSYASFRTELSHVLQAMTNNTKVDFKEIKSTYKNYVIEQRALLESDTLKDFWRNELLDFNKSYLDNEIVSDKKEQDYIRSSFSEAEAKAIEEYCLNNNIRVKNLCLSAFIKIISSLTSQEQVSIGLISNSRPNIVDSDQIFGCFTNTILFNCDLENTNSLLDLSVKVDEKVNSLKGKDKYPIGEIVNLYREMTSESSQLYDAMFNYINFHILDEIIDNIEVEEKDRYGLRNFEGQTHSSLDLVIGHFQNNINVHFNYNVSIFSKSRIETVVNNYKKSILDIVFNQKEECKLSKLIGEKVSFEKGHLANDFKNIAEKFADRKALKFEDSEYTYNQLDIVTNKLCNFIEGFTTSENSVIGIEVDRSQWTIISVLSCIKMNKTFVPIDNSLPEERKNFIKEDSKIDFLINSSTIEIFKEKIDEIKQEFEIGNFEKTNPIYILYTSGTTGNPKGVVVSHASTKNYINWFEKENNITHKDSSVLLADFSFDGVYTTIWGTLFTGGLLHVTAQDLFYNPAELTEYISKNEVTFIKLTPSILNFILNNSEEDFIKNYSALRLLVVGGESIIPKDIQNILKIRKDIAILNHYGPTECTIGISTHKISPSNIDDFSENPVIGKPIYNTTIIVVDKELKILPINTIGEICILGESLADGYLNNPIESEKFVIHPTLKSRMYRTGDIGKIDENGNIKFLKRNDNQIKVQGVRIELAEIEEIISRHKSVDKAIAICSKDSNGIKNIYCYYLSNEKIAFEEFDELVMNSLPKSFRVSNYFKLENIPYKSNGKINRNLLPSPFALSDKTKVGKAPTTDTEHKLYEIWKEVLDKDNFFIDESFFALGGHSIKVAMVLARILRQFNVRLTIKQFFEASTIEELGQKIDFAAWNENQGAENNIEEYNEFEI